jgi:bzd-type benzoyl-CoA reductase N subunit
MNLLQTLIEAARTPIQEWPQRYPGYQAMGYLCSYVPEELIHAAGIMPVRLRGSNAPLQHVDAHLQSFTCALCRSTLDQALGGDLKFLIGTVFAHTCDAMQAQADLWRLNQETNYFVDAVMQPANLGSAAARPYLIAELNRFRASLSSHMGRPITDANLEASIALYDETRRMISSLNRLRTQLSASDYYAILDAAQVMPRGIYNPLLQQLLDTPAHDPESTPAAQGPSLFLAGALLDEPRLLTLIDESDARIAGDDLCSGSRHFHDQIGTADDPISALADYYLRRPPCPTKLQPDYQPGQHLLEQVRQTGADGVVFVIEKFCEPYAFEYALVQPDLERAGLPHLILEMEQTPSLEALRTRLQAFVEML